MTLLTTNMHDRLHTHAPKHTPNVQAHKGSTHASSHDTAPMSAQSPGLFPATVRAALHTVYDQHHYILLHTRPT